MIRLLRNGVLLILTLGLVAVVGLWLALRASLPELDGRIDVAGLDQDVTLERDSAGVVTVSAPDRTALAFGLGFAHAQDRYFQMDLLRRQSAGELAELVGDAALPVDRRNRLHRFRGRARAVVGAMDAATRAVIGAYADGVNAGLDKLGAKPPEYLLLGVTPERWRPEDGILALYSMYLVLNDSRARRDVGRGYSAAAMPAAMFDWMYPTGSEWDAALDGDLPVPAPMPGPDVIDLSEHSLPAVAFKHGDVRADTQGMVGSNNWAVSGRLTVDGRAIVANDMHLGIDAPNIWYRARLLTTGADGIDVSGVTLPGAPFVVAGSNGSIAWAFTNSYGDWTDAVLLRPGESPEHYLTPDGEQAFTVHNEVLSSADGSEETLTIRETIWGPVVPDYNYPDGEIAVSWIAHHARAANVRQLDLERAKNVADALTIASSFGIPPQNFVVGDAEGNIGWTIAGQIPARGGAEKELPDDWSDGSGWQGWIASADYPRIVNPPGDRIWTANSRVVSGRNLELVGDGGYDLGARGRQIRDGLRAKEQFAVKDMLAIHLDDRALFLGRWQQFLLDVLDDDAIASNEARTQFRRLVADWTPRASVESVGYRFVRDFRREVRDRAFDMWTTPVVERFGPDVPLRRSNQFEVPLWQAVNEQPPHLLTKDYASWRDLLLASVDAQIARYAELGSELSDRTWGEHNQSTFAHPLARAVPALGRWLNLPDGALPGDADMPRVQGRRFGASERFAVAPGNEPEGYLHMPGGASGHPLSPYRVAGHEDWVSGNPSSFQPGDARHRLVLTAAP